MKLDCANSDCKYRNSDYYSNTCGSYIKKRSRLRDINFNNLRCKGLAIFVGEEHIAEGFIGEVLNQVVPFADYYIESCNYFFNEFVIRLKEKD